MMCLVRLWDNRLNQQVSAVRTMAENERLRAEELLTHASCKSSRLSPNRMCRTSRLLKLLRRWCERVLVAELVGV